MVLQHGVQNWDNLQSLIFLVEKRDGTVKTRSCADDSKQHPQPGYKKEDNSSPTADNESLMIISAINANEQYDSQGQSTTCLSSYQILMKLVYMLLNSEMAEPTCLSGVHATQR